MGYDRIETFVKNEEKPYEYCLDFEYGNSAYEALNPIERYLAYKSTGVKVDKDKQNLSNAEKFCLHSPNTYGDIPDCDGSDGREKDIQYRITPKGREARDGHRGR